MVDCWDYASLGANWGNPDDADYEENCAGQKQSPINIAWEDIYEDLDNYNDSNDDYDNPFVYDLAPLHVSCGILSGKFQNTGHNLQFVAADGNPIVTDSDFLSGGPLGSSKYFFWQLHLHWGSSHCEGSEHLVNGQRFPAELQLVHVKEDFISGNGTVDPSVYEAEDGLAVLAVFLIKGPEDAAWFDPISDASQEISESEKSETDSVLNLHQMLQIINPTFQAEFNYWFYSGSLTTPQCNEAVTWLIAERPLEISEDQLSKLFDLTQNEDISTPITNNYRVDQKLNGRIVYVVGLNIETEFNYDGPSCNCNLLGTSFDCSCEDGQCHCDTANGYTGRQCDECIDGYFVTFVSDQRITFTTNYGATCNGNLNIQTFPDDFKRIKLLLHRMWLQ